MTVRMLAGLAVALIVVVCGRVSTAAKPAAQDQPPPTAVAPETRALFVDASGMVALQRHAHVDMILDGRHTAAPALASVRLPVNAVAVTLPAGTR
jgi:hypothetical protein